MLMNPPAPSSRDGSAVSQTKKAKKIKKQPKPSPYLAAESLYPIELKNTLSKGRHILARADIKAGAIVFTEKSPAFIPKVNVASILCHECLKPAPRREATRPKLDKEGNPVEGQTETYTVAQLTCPDCDFAVYCSQECQDAHSKVHKIECPVLKQLVALYPDYSPELDTLRFVLRIYVKLQLETSQQFVAGSRIETPISFINDIPSHRETFEKDVIDATVTEIKKLASVVPELNNSKAISNLTTHACRYLSNFTQFYDYTYRGAFDAIGIFPMLAVNLKHSCTPNCIASGEQNGIVTVRALVDIPKGVEITCSQTELYQPREHRRRDLLLNRHIWCKCRRCSAALSKSVDQYMDGIVCQKCHAGLMIFEETKEVDDISELMKNANLLDDEIKGKFAHCSACSHRITVTALVDVLKNAIQKFNIAFYQYRTRNIEEARKLFEEYINEFGHGRVLHTYNSYIVNSLIPLMYCCRAMNDLPAAISHCKNAVDYMVSSNALPPNYPDITELRVTLAELMLEYAQAKSSTRVQSSMSRNLIKKYYSDAKKILDVALIEREIAAGKQSPRYTQALNYISAAQKAPADLDRLVKNDTAKPKPSTTDSEPSAAKKIIKKKVANKPPQSVIDSIKDSNKSA